MKRNFYLLVLVLLFSGLWEKSFSQIPNPSFENWTASNPDGWNSLNTPPTFVPVTQSSTAHAGSSGCKSEVITFYAIGIASPVFTGAGSTAFYLCNCRPDALHFWYIFNSAGGETFQAFGTAMQNGAGFGGAIFNAPAPTAIYKEGVANFAYSGAGNADSMSLTFLINGFPYPTDFTLGTYFIIDDLSFGPAVSAVNDPMHPAQVSLQQNSPNPSTEATNIIYTIPGNTSVTLCIYDLAGRKIKTVVDENQTPGTYKAIVDLQDFAAGNYFYRLQTDETTLTKMLTLTK